MKAEQITFIDLEGDCRLLGGILIDDAYVICGECGGVFELADDNIKIIDKFPNWVPISEEIKGDTADKTTHCPLDGDITNDCADCIYSCDYHFVDGECVEREVENHE